ncbi:hypothetical protein CVT25_000747 [Psilocybe cyanescens]|uniref:Uncharacterized protein n=1 Tax=Psilocybe cyanescens TaxID=93625 RepID=A0A409XM69_PSICY|nr:hypothetical protein CVT25_000747 [Psilocybe cyanescens]
MLSTSRSSLLLIFGFLIGLVVSSALEGTNAQRLARGLSPNPPKFIRDTSNDRTTRPTAERRSPSAVPSITLTGRLEVRNPQDESVLGYIRNWAGGGTISGINALGPDEELHVKLTFAPSHLTKINILATNPAFPAPFYVGAGTFSTNFVPELAVGSRQTVAFTNVEQTPGGAHPTIPPARDAYVESSIWSINTNTHELQAHWINEDGSKPPTVIAYDIQITQNEIFFVGDIAAYNLNNDLPASAVQLFIVPLA